MPIWSDSRPRTARNPVDSVARFRLSRPAQSDLANILATSDERWGTEGRRRYTATLAAAMRMLAADPQGPLTRDREDLLRGVRSFHTRHARTDSAPENVKAPVHVIYYRVVAADVVEVVRVLHEHMEPSRHIRKKRT